MPAAAWMTIAVAGLIIVFTAVGLIRIVLHLRAIRGTLKAVTGGVRAQRGMRTMCAKRTMDGTWTSSDAE